jgi:DNA-binding response OmpR family regulator
MPPRTVLVVEDDPVILKLLELNFEMEGFTVLTAPNGERGLEVARTKCPDAIVSDIMMPKRSGIELIVGLRDDPVTASIPVVLLSAKAQVGDVQAGLDLGADDYVTKPFEPDDLVERVNAVIDR